MIRQRAASDRHRLPDQAGRMAGAGCAAGAQRVCGNDVYVDHRGLIYLIDRNRCLSVVERIQHAACKVRRTMQSMQWIGRPRSKSE
jgi:hypothetical protein